MTKSKRLKEYFLTKVFEPNSKFTYSELKDKAEEFLGEEFSIGVINGILYKMCQNNVLRKVGYGEYTLFESELTEERDDEIIDVKVLIQNSLREAINKIQNGLSKVNILELSEDDFKYIKEIKDSISDLNSKFNL